MEIEELSIEFLQGNLMGNKGQGATGQLFWLTHPGIHHSNWVFQWRRNLCSIQELASHGTTTYTYIYNIFVTCL